MKTKIELIDRAYSKLRISGLTVNPQPEDIIIALDELESMAAEWENRNICTNYNFEDEPNSSSLSGLGREYINAFQCNLACRLAPEFGKEVPVILARQADQSFSTMTTATFKPSVVNYPDRQPVGEANSLRFNRWQRFYREGDNLPNSCSTDIMVQGDTTKGHVSYLDYLMGDTIANVEITYSGGLKELSRSNTETSVDFMVEATSYGTQTATVKIETVGGQINTRVIYYSVV